MSTTRCNPGAGPHDGSFYPYLSHTSEATATADEDGVRYSATGEKDNALNQRPGASPPGTPHQRLLDTGNADSHVQYANYPNNSDEKRYSSQLSESHDARLIERWVPVPLRPWFWIPYVLLMIGGAIALEITLHYNQKNQGWATHHSTIDSQVGYLHYAYTLPPVIVAMVLVGMWAWTDVEIKKMQPYVDLIHGNSPPDRSILLDYTRINQFLVWGRATRNRHYLVALASLMVLLTLCFQPLAAALLSVKDTYLPELDQTVSNLGLLGLNQDEQFQDLTSFMAATGFASASVLYGLGDPQFVHDVYTIAPFNLPYNVAKNGTVFATTTAVKSDPGCRTPDSIQMIQHSDGSGWTNTATSNGCSLTWNVDKNATSLFGTDVTSCSQEASVPSQFRTVVFWFFTYQPKPAASATFCTPSISFYDVAVTVDLASGNLTSVTELRPSQVGQSNFTQAAANLTGPPLNGRAYNGISFNLTNPDKFVLARQDAIQLQMPAAVFQAALTSPAGLIASFQNNLFVQLSTRIYAIYLKLIAKTVYFLPASPGTVLMTVQLKTVKPRVWMSDVAVHLLSVAMLMLAFFGTIVHLFHRLDRQDLYLAHQPGTIASAISIAGSPGMEHLLDGKQKDVDMEGVLRNRKFRINKETMKIVMEGEEGYEEGLDEGDPNDKRKSLFGRMKERQPNVRRFSRAPVSPTTPTLGSRI